MPFSFFTHIAALVGLQTLGRVGSSCSSSEMFANSSSTRYYLWEKKASASTLSGTCEARELTGYHDDGDHSEAPAHDRQELESVHVGHAEVRDDFRLAKTNPLTSAAP